jgi:hypothetical protein
MHEDISLNQKTVTLNDKYWSILFDRNTSLEFNVIEHKGMNQNKTQRW